MSTNRALNYGVRSFDLGNSRTNERVEVRTDEIVVLRADDSVDLRIGDERASPIPLRQLESIKIPDGIQHVYLSNSSGTGELVLLFGVSGVDASAGGSEISGTVDVQDRAARELGKTRIEDPSGVLVDPREIAGSDPVTDTDSGTGASNAAQLDLESVRTIVDFYVSTSGAATLTVEVSTGGNTWREFDTVDYTSATSEVEQYETGYRFVRAYLDQNRTVIEASAKGA
jgi:hypothetical protein